MRQMDQINASAVAIVASAVSTSCWYDFFQQYFLCDSQTYNNHVLLPFATIRTVNTIWC